jgi:hypothetical protein
VTSDVLWLSKSVAVESAYFLTALVVMLRDLRRDYVPQLQGLQACGCCTGSRSDRCLGNGGNLGLEREACGTTPEGAQGFAGLGLS